MIVKFDDIKRDAYGHLECPTLSINTLSRKRICPISSYMNLEANFKFNDVSEISFKVPDRYMDKDKLLKNPCFTELHGMREIYMESFGYFVLTDAPIEDDGVCRIKNCTARSLEYELNYKKVPPMDGTFMFHDPTGTSKDTAMNILLENAPNWTIGHVDNTVATRYRTFDVGGGETIYSFMMNTLQESYSCIFLFDTFERKINIYDSALAIQNIPLFLSNRNLINSGSITELSDEIVTCLSVYGADDVSIRSVNPLATDKIYNLDYFIETGDIPKEIADKWIRWKTQYDVYQKMFSYLFSDYYTNQVVYNAQNTKLTDLKNELEALNHILDNYKTDTEGDHSAAIIKTETDIAAKKKEIEAQEAVVKAANDKMESVMDDMSEITALCAFDKFFDEKELNVLNLYIREDSIQDSTYVVSYTADTPALCSEITADNTYTVSIKDGDLYRSDDYLNLSEEEIEKLDMSEEELKKLIALQESISSTHLGQNFFTINSGSISVASKKGDLDISGTVVNSTLSFTEKANDNGSHNCVIAFNINDPKIDIADSESQEEHEEPEVAVGSTALFVVSGTLSAFVYENIMDSTNSDTMSFEIKSGIATLTYDSTIYQRQSTIQDLFDYGNETLGKLAYPSYEFSIDSVNFMLMDEFRELHEKVRLGASFNLEFYEGVYLQPILIGMRLSFDDAGSFDLEFSDKFQSNNPEFKLVDMIGQAVTKSSNLDSKKFSYSAFVNSNVQNDVENLINSALDVSKNSIINSSNQSLLINDGGIHLRRLKDGSTTEFDPCEIRANNGQIVFTDDGWDTAGLAIGKIAVKNGGSTSYTMGVVAESIIGNILIGNKLTIESTGVDNITGLSNVTHFRVDGNGAFLGNAPLAIQGPPMSGKSGNQILIDPRYGIVAGDNSLFTFTSDGVKAKFIDENGNVIVDDTQVMPAGSSLFFDIDKGVAAFRGDIYADNGYFKGEITASALNIEKDAEVDGLTITTDMLDTNAIKSRNYVEGVSGSFLNLEDGTFTSHRKGGGAQIPASLKLTTGGLQVSTGRISSGNVFDSVVTLMSDGYAAAYPVENPILTMNPVKIILNASNSNIMGNLVELGITSSIDTSATGYILVNGQSVATNFLSTHSMSVTSDKNMKRDISAIDNRYLMLFDELSPVSFGFKNGDRIHTGFISQDVEAAMNKVGLSNMEFGGFCKNIKRDTSGSPILDSEGNEQVEYSLRYEEFIGIMAAKIKQLEAKLSDIENRRN